MIYITRNKLIVIEEKYWVDLNEIKSFWENDIWVIKSLLNGI